MTEKEQDLVFEKLQNVEIGTEQLREWAKEDMQYIRMMVALHPNATDEIAETCAAPGDVPELLKIRKAGVTIQALLGRAEIRANQQGFSIIKK